MIELNTPGGDKLYLMARHIVRMKRCVDSTEIISVGDVLSHVNETPLEIVARCNETRFQII